MAEEDQKADEILENMNLYDFTKEKKKTKKKKAKTVNAEATGKYHHLEGSSQVYNTKLNNLM